MSESSDVLEIVTMMASTNYLEEPKYKRVEWKQVTDQQAGNYDNGQVSFDLTQLRAQFIVIADSYLVVPITPVQKSLVMTKSTRTERG